MNIRNLRLSRFSRRDLALIGIPALALVVLAFWTAFLFVKPAPPKTLVMTTGSEEGGYHAFGRVYQEILARHGITLELRTSAGSVENLRRLRDEGSGVDIGFVQSGTGTAEDYEDLVSLGSVYYEPVWVFFRKGNDNDHLHKLRGRRIAVGMEGSGTLRLTTQLLNANDAFAPPTRIVPIGGAPAADALLKGQIDAVFIVGPAEMEVVHKLLFARDVDVISFSRAPAYTRLFPFLNTVKLPEGSMDLIRNIPAKDTVLLAPTANIVAREEVHPALLGLMLQAMEEVHGSPGLFHNAGDFPKVLDHDFPVSDEAARFYKSGPPLLQRYLPFWAATFIERTLVLLVPILAILLPLVRITPPLYTWRIRSRIYRWYGELKFLELEIRDSFDASRIDDYRRRLDALDERANTRPIPLSFTDQVYTLRQHIEMVRGLLEKAARRK